MIEHPIGRECMVGNVDNLWATFRVNKDFSVGIGFFEFFNIVGCYAMVCGAIARPENDFFIGETLYVVAEILIRYKDDFVGVEAFDHFDAVCGGAADI